MQACASKIMRTLCNLRRPSQKPLKQSTQAWLTSPTLKTPSFHLELLGHQNIFGPTASTGARSHHWQRPVHVSGLVGRHRILQTTFFKDAQENYEAADNAKGSSMSSGSHCLTTQLLLYADLNCQKARCLNAVDGLPMAVSPAPP